MSFISVVIVIITIYIVLFTKDKCFNLFLEASSLLLFSNLGSLFIDQRFDFLSREVFVCLVLIFLKVFGVKRIGINKKTAIASILVIISILIGYTSILLFQTGAYIAPMNITYDEILLGDGSLSKPNFGNSNLSAFVNTCIFILTIILCRDYFFQKKYVNKIVIYFEKSIEVFFCIVLIEFLLVNFFNIDNYRTIILKIFGVIDFKKVYAYSTVRIGKIKSAFAFFSEPSYMCGPLLVYYFINYAKGILSYKKMLMFIISFCVGIISGSTNAVITLFFGLVVFFKVIFIDNKNINITKITVILLFICILISGFVFLKNNKYITENFNSNVIVKISSYIHLAKNKSGFSASGYVRGYGNMVCYSVLKYNPFFGVGLGTTRGYGFIPSMLATLGIVGSISLINFYFTALNIYVNKNNVVSFVILSLMLTGFYSAIQMYSLILVPILISFNKCIIKKE